MQRNFCCSIFHSVQTVYSNLLSQKIVAFNALALTSYHTLAQHYIKLQLSKSIKCHLCHLLSILHTYSRNKTKLRMFIEFRRLEIGRQPRMMMRNRMQRASQECSNFICRYQGDLIFSDQAQYEVQNWSLINVYQKHFSI